MATTLRVPPAKKPEPKIDLVEEVRQVLLQAVGALNIALLNNGIELEPAPVRSDRIAEFSIQHLPDDHAVGFLRATNFVPVMGNSPQGLVQKGFKISLFLHLELAVNHNDVFDVEAKFPWGFEARDKLKSSVFAGVSKRLLEWTK